MYLLIFLLSAGTLYLPDNPETVVPDTVYLDQIIISAPQWNRAELLQPVSNYRIDSTAYVLNSAGGFADLLRQFTPVSVRDYGPGGSIMLSHRGLGAHQTQVYWHGFPINHSMLGLSDLSIIPAAGLSTIQVSGAGSSLHGSGSMSGSIHIMQDGSTHNAEVSQQVGSFGKFQTDIAGNYRSKNIRIHVAAGQETAENNFLYDDVSAAPIVQRERINNHIEKKYALLNARFVQNRHVVDSGLWISETKRGVPGSILSRTPNSSQYDFFARMRLAYRYLHENYTTGISTFYNSQELNFFLPSSNVESFSEITDMEIRLPAEWNIKEQIHTTFQAGWKHSQVETNNYPVFDRNVFHFHLSADAEILDGTLLYPSIRKDFYDDFGSAWSLGLGLNQRLIQDELSIRFWAGNNFTAPTFNDLYWPELGNPDLLPEKSIRLETGLAYLPTILDQTRLQATFFAAKITDGIQWLPESDGMYRPVNIRELEVRGLELDGKSAFTINRVLFQVSGGYEYTSSKFTASRFEGDQTPGKQVPYVPLHSTRASFLANYNRYALQINHYYAGKRFITDDNSRSVEAYHTMGLAASAALDFQQVSGLLIFNIQNLTNASYHVVEWYPMPGRSYNLTLKLRI